MTQEDAMKMNNEQAIQILKPFRDMMFDQHGCPISDAVFALDKAIEALETMEKAKDGTRCWGCNCPKMEPCAITQFGECSYSETGCSDCETKEKIRKALEKQIPKRYAIHNGGYDCEGTFLGSTNCSNCDHELDGFEDYCPNCGQAISWEDEDD